MKFRLLHFLSVCILFSACLTYGHPQPHFLVNGKVIPFDAKYLRSASPEIHDIWFRFLDQMIDRVIATGTTSVGRINLKNLKLEFRQLHFIGVDQQAWAIGIGAFTSRLGSVSIPETKTVYINFNTMDEDFYGLAILLIHESLIALSYEDQNYQISSVLGSTRVREIAQLLDKKNIDFSKKKGISKPYQLAGGTSVVGPGGDEVLFEAKVFMLDSFKDWVRVLLPLDLKQTNYSIDPKIQKNLLEDFLIAFIQAPFESMDVTSTWPAGPLQNIQEIEKICGVYNNSGTLYLRLSSLHWKKPIAGLGLYRSRLWITDYLYFNFLSAWLNQQGYR